MDNDIILFDRIKIIQDLNDKYDLCNNAYLSFSGGKDSTIVHYLLDIALPNNKIPRVFVNTGVEYNYIVDFVNDLSKNDDRFIIIKPKVPVGIVLREFGYPFKSKIHSRFVMLYQNNRYLNSVDRYINGIYYDKCPNILKYQFTPSFNLKISDRCCFKLKKDTCLDYEIENNKSIVITGIRKEEGGYRSIIKGCSLFYSDGSLHKFHPLLVVDKSFEDWFIDKFNIKLCKLYYPPFNFDRTGCKGCPFNPKLKEDLNTLSNLLPMEYKQICGIWKPIYDEYKRIGYRLDSENE